VKQHSDVYLVDSDTESPSRGLEHAYLIILVIVIQEASRAIPVRIDSRVKLIFQKEKGSAVYGGIVTSASCEKRDDHYGDRQVTEQGTVDSSRALIVRERLVMVAESARGICWKLRYLVCRQALTSSVNG
jgi:hypothetical protein